MQARATSSTEAVTKTDRLTKLIPGASHSLAHLSDSELLATTRHLVGKSNQVFAALLIHLAEVEARGIYRTRSCSSLYTYCIYELRFSEDAASRRASAAKLVKLFPALLDAVASGELHLTGLLMLGPHLTAENHLGVLARAKFRTKKEIAKLVRMLAPLPQVPDRIEPLGPELPSAPRNPTWEEFVQSLCPPIRELAPGERPRDWANDALAHDDIEPKGGERAQGGELSSNARDPAPAPDGDEPSELPPLTAPQFYQMQFTTVEEHVELVERAKALLSRESGRGLGELHLQAMRMLVAALEKKRFAVGAKPRRRPSRPKQDVVLSEPSSSGRTGDSTSQQSGTTDSQSHDGTLEQSETTEPPRRRGRYIRAAKRRAVFERDDGRCTYIDERGQRCRETHGLEIHHLKAFGKGGEHELSNLTLRCAPHNTLAAEEDFGRDYIVRKRNSRRHEARSRCD